MDNQLKKGDTVSVNALNLQTSKREIFDAEFVEYGQKGIAVIRHPKRGLITINSKLLNA